MRQFRLCLPPCPSLPHPSITFTFYFVGALKSFQKAAEAQAKSETHPSESTSRAAPSSAPSRKPAELEKAEVLDVLRSVDWSPEAARKTLGISKNSLYALMTQYEIPRAQDLERPTIEQALQDNGGDTGFAADALQVSERGLKLRMKALELSD